MLGSNDIARKLSTRRPGLFLAASVSAALCGPQVFGESVTDWHTFRAATATPLTGQGTDDPTIGNLTGGTADASFLIGYLATPLSLANEGDQISFSFNVRFNDLTGMSSPGDNFRFALFDENGQTRVTANETPTAGVDQQTDNFRGYIFGQKGGGGAGDAGSSRERIGALLSGDNAFAATGTNSPTVTASQGVGGENVPLISSVNGNNAGPTYLGNMTVTKTATGVRTTGVLLNGGTLVGNVFNFNDTTAPTSSTFGALGFLAGDALNVEEVSFQDVTVNAVPTTRYWDINGASAGAGGASPSGNWDGGKGFNFNSDFAGGAGIFSAVTTPTSEVIFAAGNEGADAYTVTVSGTQSAGSVQVAQGSVTLNGGTLATDAFNIATGATGTIASALSGGATGNLTKSGSGTLVLANANTYTGTTSVNGGRLQATKSTALPGYNAANKVFVGNDTTLAVNVGGSGQWTDTEINDLYTNASFGTNTNFAFDSSGGDFTYGFSLNKPTSVTKEGANALTLSAANTHTGGTTVTAGTLVVAHGDALGTGSLTIADTATTVAQASLPKAVSVNSVTTSGSGKLDLKNNALVVKGSNLAAIDALVTQGYNNGDWLGGGIASSTSATDPSGLTAIGYFDNAEFGATDFEGVTGLDGDDILVKYTYYGDADLNGVVDPDDFNQFLAGFQDSTLPRTWLYGDFDYNNVIDPDDFNLFLAAFQNNGAQLSELENAIEMSSLSSADQQLLLGAIAAVPEPTSLGLLGLAAGGLLARRRRTA